MLEIDFTLGKKAYPDLKKGLYGIDIGILGFILLHYNKIILHKYHCMIIDTYVAVNNLFSKEIPCDFVKQDEMYLSKLIDTKMIATTMVYRTIIPQLKDKKKGAIINVLFEDPNSLSMYSATEV